MYMELLEVRAEEALVEVITSKNESIEEHFNSKKEKLTTLYD
jgi:hypothetical protein